VENEYNSKKIESVFSKKVRAGKRRTYFFDVRQTKGEEYYLTLTESTKKFDRDGYERHKIFLYKEDFNRFIDGLTEALDKIKNELMPDYDYEEFTRKHEQWDKERAEGLLENGENTHNKPANTSEDTPDAEIKDKPASSEDDMSW